MPPQVLVQTANDFYKRNAFREEGIYGGTELILDTVRTLAHVRESRRRSAKVARQQVLELCGRKLIREHASFLEPGVLKIGKRIIRARRVILATGSRPAVELVPRSCWDRVLTEDHLFELKDLPSSVAVLGLGAVGLSLAQALRRLGVHVVGLDPKNELGGARDPKIRAYAREILAREFPVHGGSRIHIENQRDRLNLRVDGGRYLVEALLVTDRVANVAALNLEALGLPLDADGVPRYDASTLETESPSVYFTGKAQSIREAQARGEVAGYNCLFAGAKSVKLRRRFELCFSDPTMASVGLAFDNLPPGTLFGESFFENSRPVKKGAPPIGRLRIFVEPETGTLLGSEMMVPGAEPLAHLMAWSVQQKLELRDVLNLPFYLPSVEKGFRIALRDAAEKLASDRREWETSYLPGKFRGTEKTNGRSRREAG